jgi:hypothetical protein
MSTKEIKIPLDYEFPDDFDSFSPEENACLLIAGYQYIRAVKSGIFENPKKKEEIEKKLKEIFETSLHEKEQTIQFLKQTNETTKTIYEEMLAKEREAIKREIFETSSKEIEKITRQLEEERKRCSLLEHAQIRLEEKSKHSSEHIQLKELEMRFMKEKEDMNQRMVDLSLEKSKISEEFSQYKIAVLEKEKQEMTAKQKNTVAKQRGSNGEDILLDILQRTFSSLNCEIDNTSRGTHKGDFHLKFEKFTVLVDCKNYIDSKNVNIESRKQIKHDLEQNRHIKIAWLISLNKPISKYGGVPWQFDLEDGICCFYVNELLCHVNPEETLKMVWKASCILYSILDVNTADTAEFSRLKEYELRVKNIYERLHTLSKQRNSILLQSIENLNHLKNNFIETDKTDIELINRYISDIGEIQEERIKEWWNANIVFKDGNKLKSDEIYKRFVAIDENKDMDKSLFREILCHLVKEDEVKKGKGEKTQYTFTNYGWKI